VFFAAREGGKRRIERTDPAAPQGRFAESIGGLRILPALTSYCVSKAGVVMLGHCLAREWARYNINVNTLCPGFFETDINEEWFRTEAGQKQIARFPAPMTHEQKRCNRRRALFAIGCAHATTGAALTVDDAQETF
jgi:NAD(P)-dependent dehydrogenase (short-subunit alcohol dehydrogenase family)